MPSIGISRNVIPHHSHSYDENRCNCCPYGYHIDRDFVPFTKKMLSREGDFKRLQELKDKWRCERQSMDELLGVPAIHRNWGVETISRASTDIWHDSIKPIYNVAILDVTDHKVPDFCENFNLPFGNGLDEAVTDFEEALLRTRPQARVLSYDIPDSHKYHTFPRIKAPVLRDLDSVNNLMGSNTQLTSKGSSTASSTTASTIIMKESNKRHSTRDLSKHNNKRDGDTFSSLESTFNTRELHEIQDLAMNNRIQDLEKQVKLIPELEGKLTLLKEEKRQLMKLLEVEKEKQASTKEDKHKLFVTKTDSNSNFKRVTGNILLDDTLNGKSSECERSGEPKAPPRRKTRDAGVGRTILTRDVGISHTMPRTRTIGTGTAETISNWERSSGGDSSSPTGSVSGTLRRRIRSFETGVQVNDHDLVDDTKIAVPLLQIIERKDVGIQALIEDPSKLCPMKVEKSTQGKSIGVSVKPNTRDIGYMVKPNLRDSSSNTVQESEQKAMRNVGVTACLGTDSLSEDKIRPKSSRHIAINTDKLRVHTVAVNTTEPLEKKKSAFDSNSTYTQTSFSESSFRKSPSPLDRDSSERSCVYESKAQISLSSTMQTEKSEVSKRTTEEQSSLSRAGLTLSVLPSVPSHSPRSVYTSMQSPVVSPSEAKVVSRIPRLSSPMLSPAASPKVSSMPIPIPYSAKNQSQGDDSGSSSSSSASPVNASTMTFKAQSTSNLPSTGLRKPGFFRSDTYTKEMHLQSERLLPGMLEPLEEEERERPRASYLSQENREKSTPSKEMQGALKVLNDALLRGRTTQEVTSAISVILHEWFRVAGTKTANPLDVEDYLDVFESYSPQLLRYIVNMPDGNGNTGMHYAVSHGNFDVVSILLDSKVCDPNKANKAGYTSVMLVSLAKVLSETHRQVVRRLFGLGDVNIKAAQHGQTALMLGASHGRLDTVRLLLEAGADINIQDEDGSTALMCASEHGHGEIVKYLLAQADCDPHITDNDGSTALTVAMEAGHKDIGVMLYAHMHFVKAPSSPYSGLAKRSRSTTPRSSPSSKSNSPITSAQTSPVAAKKQNSSSFP